MFAGIRGRIAEVAAVAPRAYWYVWWGTLVNRIGGFVTPMLTIYLIRVRHVSVSEAGGVVAVFGAGAVAASLAGGYLADKLGRKITLVISLFGGALSLAALSQARELNAIMVMVGVVGFVGELYRPAVSAMVADLVPASRRVQAYALLHWVINIGFACAAIVGGLLADVNFTLLFLLDAATMAIYGVIVLVCVPETRPRSAAGATAPGPARPSPSWLADREFVVYIALALVFALMSVQTYAPLAAHMTWQGLNPSMFGLVMSVNGIVITLLQPTISSWVIGRDTTRVLIAATLLFGSGLALHGLANGVAMHAAAVMVWTLGEIIESPTRSTLISAMAPTDARARYQGASVMTYGVGHMFGPKLGTWVWEHVGPSALWAGCLALSIAIAIGLAATGPARRRRLARSTA
jgi:MFS family permease